MVDAAAVFLQDVTKHKKHGTVAVFLDITKAFDLSNSISILSSLVHAGVKGKHFSWLRNFLTDRTRGKVVRASKPFPKEHILCNYDGLLLEPAEAAEFLEQAEANMHDPEKGKTEYYFIFDYDGRSHGKPKRSPAKQSLPGAGCAARATRPSIATRRRLQTKM